MAKKKLINQEQIYLYNDFVLSAEKHDYQIFDWGDHQTTINRNMIVTSGYVGSDLPCLFDTSWTNEEWERNLDPYTRFDLTKMATLKHSEDSNYLVTVYKLELNPSGNYRFAKLEDVNKLLSLDQAIEFRDIKKSFSRYAIAVDAETKPVKVNPCDKLFER